MKVCSVVRLMVLDFGVLRNDPSNGDARAHLDLPGIRAIADIDRNHRRLVDCGLKLMCVLFEPIERKADGWVELPCSIFSLGLHTRQLLLSAINLQSLGVQSSSALTSSDDSRCPELASQGRRCFLRIAGG